jgi:hypothetical protein
LSVTLLLPQNTPLDALDSYAVSLSWDGGAWDASLPFGDGTVSLLPPRPPATFDLVVLGVVDGGVLWRGIARAVSPDAAEAKVFFGKVGAFSSFSEMPNGLPGAAGSSACPLGVGQVLVVGGITADQRLLQVAMVYDHLSMSYTLASPPAAAMSHHLALPLSLRDPAGAPEWLLAGGDGATGASSHAEIYSPNYGGSVQPDLPVGQVAPSGSWIDDGGMVGCGLTPDGDAGAFAFNPGSGFTSLVAGNCSGGALLWVPDAGLAVLGLDSGVSFLLPDGGLQPVAALTVTSGFGSVVYDGGLLVLGGVGPAGVSGAVSRVWPQAGSGALIAARANFGLLVLDGGLALLVGGQDENGASLPNGELFDLATLQPTGQLITMQFGRIRPAVSDIPGYEAALVVSGEDDAGAPASGFEVFTYP